MTWPHRLVVRTSPSQGGDTGSTPVGANYIVKNLKFSLIFFDNLLAMSRLNLIFGYHQMRYMGELKAKLGQITPRKKPREKRLYIAETGVLELVGLQDFLGARSFENVVDCITRGAVNEQFIEEIEGQNQAAIGLLPAVVSGLIPGAEDSFNANELLEASSLGYEVCEEVLIPEAVLAGLKSDWLTIQRNLMWVGEDEFDLSVFCRLIHGSALYDHEHVKIRDDSFIALLRNKLAQYDIVTSARGFNHLSHLRGMEPAPNIYYYSDLRQPEALKGFIEKDPNHYTPYDLLLMMMKDIFVQLSEGEDSDISGALLIVNALPADPAIIQAFFQEFVGMPFGSIKKVLLEELQANPGPLTSFRGMAQRAGNLDQI